MNLKGVSLILVLVMLLTPSAYAWKTVTHYDTAQVIYEKLPSSKKLKLNVNVMVDGSNDPDEKFHATVRRSFPGASPKLRSGLTVAGAPTKTGTTGMQATVLVLQATT
ncbi:putative protein {ECO:0000313/EMBL:AAB84560,1} [Methanothermobacter wolfeii]|nr:putative protein {ECO:0000313/EMBL:AAB84560,1} [Methanothermobacter wolfeii]